MKNLSVCWFYLFVLVSCQSEKKIDRSVVDEVKKSSEVKKLSEAEIIDHAIKWGNEISQEAQEALIGALQGAIAGKGVAGAIGFCHEEALPITQKTAEKHRVKIKRVSSKNRNPDNAPNEDEQEVWDAYVYNAENNVDNRPNIQKIDGGETLLYTRAIQIPSSLCLNCHGEPGKDIDETTLGTIHQIYPEDKATGYKVGDLRGMWSIYLPKKEVVKRM
ncbi:Tll0287-like domain-containing protein [Negadavirga shengliensis]|uniref:DUF3365 domain-containing protein n=1 Tax=Negadavirga shengliensis TaxID=1389218 RepID=A0ABV9T0J8_9BACT